MAGKEDLDFTYTTIDKIFRLSIGEMSDFSGAKYDGDFSITLEEAQEAKHKFIADNLDIKKGDKVLDLGCGWGAMTRYVTKERGADCVGLTLSQGQAVACQKNGLDVHVKDCRYVTPEDFGKFDAISSVGAFEHFCSIEEWQAGKQEEVYKNFFKTVADLIPSGKRVFIQTMVFGKNMIPYEEFDIDAEVGSGPHVLALMVKEFPGSWLPYGPEMVENCASEHFKLVNKHSGRIDYIETIAQWRKKFRKFNLQKYLLYLSLVPKLFYDKEFRHQVSIFKVSPNKVCFEKEIMEHYRFVFEKK